MTPEQIAASGSEHAEQAALFQWIAQFCYTQKQAITNIPTYNVPGIERLSLLFAINNAVGRNSAIHGARNKAEGVKAGVPDLFLPVPVWQGEDFAQSYNISRYHGLFIEMKQRKFHNHKAGGCSEQQLAWYEDLRSQGYRVEVCFGWEHARDVLLEYLS